MPNNNELNPLTGLPVGTKVDAKDIKLPSSITGNIENAAQSELLTTDPLSKYTDRGIDVVPNTNLREKLADSQGVLEQAKNSIVGGILSGLATAVQDFSYIPQLFSSHWEENAVSDAMIRAKEGIDEELPIYTKTDGMFDWNDGAFVWKVLKGTLDSAVGFAIPGGVVSKGLGTLGKVAKLEKLAGLLSKSPKVYEAMMSLGTGYVLNRMEGTMMGVELYNKSMKEMEGDIASGKITQAEAERIASQKADEFRNWNTMFAITDAIGVHGIIKGYGFTRNLKTKGWGLTEMSMENPILQAIKESGGEIGQNIIQSEKEFETYRDLGLKDKANNLSTKTNLMGRIIDFGTSQQALYEGMLGLVGGYPQHIITKVASGAYGKDAREREENYYNEQQKTISKNEAYLKGINDISLNYAELKREALKKGDTKAAEALDKMNFTNIATQNFVNGTTEHLERTLDDVINLSPEQAKERGYTPDYSSKAQSLKKEMLTLENDWLNTSKYINHEQVFLTKQDAKVHQLLYNSELQKSNEKAAEVNTEATRLLQKYNTLMTKEQGHDILGLTFDLNNIDNPNLSSEGLKPYYEQFVNELKATPAYDEYFSHKVTELAQTEEALDNTNAKYKAITSNKFQETVKTLQETVKEKQVEEKKNKEKEEVKAKHKEKVAEIKAKVAAVITPKTNAVIVGQSDNDRLLGKPDLTGTETSTESLNNTEQSDLETPISIGNIQQEDPTDTPQDVETMSSNNIEAKKADIERRRQEELDRETPVKNENIIVNDGTDNLTFKIITFKDGSTLVRHIKTNETTADNKSKKLITYPTLEDFQNLLKYDFDENAKIIKTELVKDDYTDKQSQEVKATKEKTINAKYDAEYVDKVKKGEFTAQQAKDALKEINRLTPELSKQLDDAELAALESPQQSNEEVQKADIEIGKVGNTEYEVKSDGVYYQGKKLNNPENKTHRQLIEADIERRRPTSYIKDSKDKKSSLETFRNGAKREWDGVSVITGDRMKNLYVGIQLFVEAYPEHKDLLDKFIKKENGTIGITNNNLSFVLNTLKKQGVTTESELGVKINAKYDAELKALEQQPTSNQSEIEVTPQDNNTSSKEELEAQLADANERYDIANYSGNVEDFEAAQAEIQSLTKQLKDLEELTPTEETVVVQTDAQQEEVTANEISQQEYTDDTNDDVEETNIATENFVEKEDLEEEEYFKSEFGSNILAYLSRLYNGFTSREDIDNLLNEELKDKSILDPDKFQPGTKITLRVKDNDATDMYIPGTKDKTTWGEYKIAHPEIKVGTEAYNNLVPIVILDTNGNEIADLHTTDWIRTENIFGDVQEDSIRLSKIRKHILANNGKLDSIITRKTNGKLFKLINGAKETIAKAFPDKNLHIVYSDKGNLKNVPTKIAEATNMEFVKSGITYIVVPVNKNSYIPLPLQQKKVNTEIAQSISIAISIWYKSKGVASNLDSDSKVIAEAIYNETGLNITQNEDLRKYVTLFINSYDIPAEIEAKIPKDSKDSKLKIYLEGTSVKSTTHLLSVTGNTIDFGTGAKFTGSLSHATPENVANDLLSKLTSHIENMYLHINHSLLTKDNVKMPVINNDGTLSDINNNSSYKDFVRNNTETKYLSHNIGTEENPKYVYTIQPVIEYDTSFVDDVNTRINNELQAERNGVKTEITKANENIAKTINPLTGEEINIDKDSFDEDFLPLTQNQIDYVLKSVNILQSNKAKQVFTKGEKANWDLKKILDELQIPKEQKQLILDKGFKVLTNNDARVVGTTEQTLREEIITSLLADYSYTIEINTAMEKAGGTFEQLAARGLNPFEEAEEDTPETTTRVATQHYSNLTVPGGTNYTENEIATPLITPSIKGHAQFSTDKGIGWFRLDDKIEFLDKEDLIKKGIIKQVPCG